MRLLVLILCCLVTAAHAGPFTVVTWNVEYLKAGRKPDERRADQMAIAQKVVAELKPDVLLTQEIANLATSDELITGLPGFKTAIVSQFPPASPYQRGTQELMISSRFPLNSAWFAAWKSNAESQPPRGYSFAALKLAADHFLLVYSLHLKANGRGASAVSIAQREESARQLVEHLEEMKKLYGARGRISVLVGGDFNTNPDDPNYKDEKTFPTLLSAGLEWCFKGVPMSERGTLPAAEGFPDNNFDHLFYANLKLISVRVGDRQGASDHNPVAAVFEP